jgi:magnesium and cobalt exporter, CNNM family
LSTSNVIELGVALIALVIVALSSWTETCLSAVSRVNIRRLLDDRYARADEHAIERAQALRSSILLVELLAAGLASTMIVAAARDIVGANGTAVGLVVVAGLLIVIGRMIPRVLAGDEPDGDAPAVSRIGRTLVFVFAPIVRPVEWLIGALTRGRERRETPSVDETSNGDANSSASNVDRERHEDDPIEEDEQEMISGILHLEQATARDIMVPRIDIVGTSREVLVSEAVDVAMQAGHSRIPVYGRSIDEILGVLYVKDLLRYVNEDHEGIVIEALMRPAYFVPESKRVDDLLNDLQQQKVHLAVVVDEYGGTAGVVTIEDILEEIVGEIQDEFDPESRRIEIINDNEAIADGALSIDDLSDEMEIEWPEHVSGTIGGYIQRQLGRIPSEGEVVQVDGIRLTVLAVEHRRVRQVRVEHRLHDAEQAADEEPAVSPSA